MRLSLFSSLLFLFVSSPFSVFSQSSEEEEYPFPDDYSAQINQEINTYQDYDYGLTKLYTLKLLKHAKECDEEELMLLSYTALEFYSYYFNKREDFEAITIETDSVFQSIALNQILSKYPDYYFEHLNHYCIYLNRKNEIAKADTLITNAIELLENNTFDQATKNYYLSTFYESLSSFKQMQWNFSEGLSLLKKASYLEEKSSFSSGFVNTNLSSHYQKIGNDYEALYYAKLALENYKDAYYSDTIYQYSRFYLQSLNKLAKLYVNLGYPTQARNYLDEMSSFSLTNYPLVELRSLQIYAQIDLSESNPTFALKNYQKCLKIQQQKLPNRIIEKVEVQKSIAEIYCQQNQQDSTFHYLQQAIIELTNNPYLNDIEANPIEFDRVVYKQYLLDILQYKSEVLLEQYALSEDPCDLIIARKTSESAQNLSDKIRLELSSNFDKELFSKLGHKVYIQAMKIAALSEELEHSEANIDFAYRAMESSRALILAEAVYQSNTTNFAGIPEEPIKREEELRKQIEERERQIFQLEQEGVDAEEYKGYKRELQTDFDKFTDSLKTHYPDYYNLKFAVQRPDIKVLQADLRSNNQVFVEYLLGEEKIYALLVSGDRYELKHWKKSPRLQEQIRALRTAIYIPDNYNEDTKIFANYADTLYRELVLPLGDLPNRLVIVPDGVLNYLPFDVLLTESPDLIGNYQDYKFLLKRKQISYDYSANLRMQKRKTRKTENDFIGFAPQYVNKKAILSRGVGNLKHNITEVDSISLIYDGISYTGEQANVTKFKQEARKAWILHFAGHAVQEEINPDFSHLLFSGSTSNNNKTNQMPLREIYAHSISAEMVVLSACNTGMGQIQRGEGMYSLGRAFSYAGANSLISTLWSINDESTEQIMIDFYINLKEGMTKDEALQQAKIMYIEGGETHKKVQPMHWAGFVAYGDMRALDFGGWFERWF